MVVVLYQRSHLIILPCRLQAWVSFSKGENSDNFIQLLFLLEGLLGRPVELVTLGSLSPCIRLHIMREVEYITFSF